MPTTNYNLPLFEENDAVDLIGVYNSAMNKVDTLLNQLNTAVQTATTAAGAAQSAASAAQTAAENAETTANGVAGTANEALETAQQAQSAVSGITKDSGDATLTVGDIRTAKVTSGGFIYNA